MILVHGAEPTYLICLNSCSFPHKILFEGGSISVYYGILRYDSVFKQRGLAWTYAVWSVIGTLIGRYIYIYIYIYI